MRTLKEVYEDIKTAEARIVQISSKPAFTRQPLPWQIGSMGVLSEAQNKEVARLNQEIDDLKTLAGMKIYFGEVD